MTYDCLPHQVRVLLEEYERRRAALPILEKTLLMWVHKRRYRMLRSAKRNAIERARERIRSAGQKIARVMLPFLGARRQHGHERRRQLEQQRQRAVLEQLAAARIQRAFAARRERAGDDDDDDDEIVYLPHLPRLKSQRFSSSRASSAADARLTRTPLSLLRTAARRVATGELAAMEASASAAAAAAALSAEVVDGVFEGRVLHAGHLWLSAEGGDAPSRPRAEWYCVLLSSRLLLCLERARAGDGSAAAAGAAASAGKVHRSRSIEGGERPFAIGANVLVKRTDGSESAATVEKCEMDIVGRPLYTVKLEDGHMKRALERDVRGRPAGAARGEGSAVVSESASGGSSGSGGSFDAANGEARRVIPIRLESGVAVRALGGRGERLAMVRPAKAPTTTLATAFELTCNGRRWTAEPALLGHDDTQHTVCARAVQVWVRRLCAVLISEESRGSRVTLGGAGYRATLGWRAAGGLDDDDDDDDDDEREELPAPPCYLAGQWKEGCYYAGDGSVAYYVGTCPDDPY